LIVRFEPKVRPRRAGVVIVEDVEVGAAGVPMLIVALSRVSLPWA